MHGAPSSRSGFRAGLTTALRQSAPIVAVLVLLGACGPAPSGGHTPSPEAHRSQFASIILDTHDPAVRNGFTTLDATPSQLADVPAGAHVLVWLGGYANSSCTWDLGDGEVRADFAHYGLATDSRVTGYFLADEPNTDHRCPGASDQVRARAALVRSLDPDTRHYTLANIDDPGQFASFKGAVDVLATDPYPCRVGAACDWTQIPAYVGRLKASGVTRYMGFLQAFAGGAWRWPTAAELRRMIGQWRRSDWCGAITFAWSYQGQDLASHPDLLAVLRAFNADLPAAPGGCARSG